jgi:hypothetical protein
MITRTDRRLNAVVETLESWSADSGGLWSIGRDRTGFALRLNKWRSSKSVTFRGQDIPAEDVLLACTRHIDED